MKNFIDLVLLGVLVSCATFGCAEQAGNITKATAEALPVDALDWQVVAPSPSHVVLFHTEGRTIAKRLFLVDFGQDSVPSTIVLPSSFATATLLPNGRRLDCVDGTGNGWSFTVDSTSDHGENVVLTAVGISEMNDPLGWDVQKAEVFTGSGWDLVDTVQVGKAGPVTVPGK